MSAGTAVQAGRQSPARISASRVGRPSSPRAARASAARGRRESWATRRRGTGC